jgi:hypothetical protein
MHPTGLADPMSMVASSFEESAADDRSHLASLELQQRISQIGMKHLEIVEDAGLQAPLGQQIGLEDQDLVTRHLVPLGQVH